MGVAGPSISLISPCYNLILFIVGLVSYLNSVLEVDIPPSQHWFCAIATAVLWTACLCSTLFILSMTFDRFYSIIRPHKAASFNTVKRAKITIAFIIVISVVFNIPYLYVISNLGRTCLPVQSHQWQEIYFWLTYVMQFVFPFVSLLSMNSVIIHTLRNRTMVIMQPENRKGQCQGQGQLKKVKGIEKQTYAILLLVSFSFFVLITPLYVSLLYTRLVDYMKTPRSFAGFNLFYHVMHKMFYTNNGINFFLYVISGRKFRNDLKQLFVCNRDKGTYTYSGSSDTNTKISTVEGDRF